MKRVLVAEDEQNIREFVVIHLKRAGYETYEATNGEEAIEIYNRLHGEIDVAVLDIMMPGQYDGLEVCKYLRKDNSFVGIVMLTAKTQEMDKVNGLMMGADDYISKPFSPSELVARVDAIYRRVAQAAERKQDKLCDELKSGEFTLNLRNRLLFKNGKPIELTQVEFQMMEYFFSNPEVTLERRDILQYVWGPSYVGEEKIVDVNIRRLRMKVEDEASSPKHIVTVWGLGYRWAV